MKLKVLFFMTMLGAYSQFYAAETNQSTPDKVLVLNPEPKKSEVDYALLPYDSATMEKSRMESFYQIKAGHEHKFTTAFWRKVNTDDAKK